MAGWRMSGLHTAIKIWQPFVFFVSIRFIIVFRTLLSTKAGLIIGTRIQIAHLVSNAFAHTKCTFILRSWVITFSTSDWYATSTTTWAFTVFSPIAPLSINWWWLIFDCYTFLILTPLKKKKNDFNLDLESSVRKGKIYSDFHTLCRPQLVPPAAGRSCVTHSSLTKHHNCEQISSIFEQTFTVSSVVLNCNRHCKSALYIAPAGKSG